MIELGGFWSYVHADDEGDSGRISDLARDLVAQYEMLTTESIRLFLDRDSLEWGNEWRGKVDGSLDSVAFFVPVVTPRYFQSAECRRELRTFAQQAESLGVGQLVMPLIYVDFPALHDPDPADELIAMVKRFQWEVWTDVRFDDRTSGAYRLRVFGLAERLARANLDAAETAVQLASTPPTDSAPGGVPIPGDAPDDEEPGLLDRIAESEAAMPEWVANLERIGEIIVEMGELMADAQAEMEKAEARGQGFAGRLTALRRLSQALAPGGEEVLRLSSEFVQNLNRVDSGVRAILTTAPQALADPENADGVREFFGMVRDLSTSAHDGLGAIAHTLEQMEPVEAMSRDLRPVLRKYRQGLTDMFESRAITDAWTGLIDEAEATHAVATQPSA